MWKKTLTKRINWVLLQTFVWSPIKRSTQPLPWAFLSPIRPSYMSGASRLELTITCEDIIDETSEGRTAHYRAEDIRQCLRPNRSSGTSQRQQTGLWWTQAMIWITRMCDIDRPETPLQRHDPGRWAHMHLKLVERRNVMVMWADKNLKHLSFWRAAAWTKCQTTRGNK